MKNKILPLIIILIVMAAAASGVVLSNQKEIKIDTVTLNDIKTEVEKNIRDYSKIDSQSYNIIVISSDGTVEYSTSEAADKSYEEWLNYAYKNDFIILDYSQGKIFILKPKSKLTDTVVLTVSLFSATLIILLIIYNLYISKTIFAPFKRLKEFAGEVAYGNLDSPLLIDKNNAFGAFSESFDIMRAELKKSKENEIALEKSKKQLVAELSHDIKTPVATIKAVNELLKLNETDAKKLKNIEIIRQKAVEIDNLITDMFNAALQDLSELKINVSTISSEDIERIINESDYLNKINAFTVPECLVEADIIRLTQIAGNIINNSYKYADTEINIVSSIDDNILNIEFQDLGKGVPEEELPLITNKFYRGRSTEGKSGAGLGLYICKNILEKMSGGIDCYNTQDGFAVRIFLKLS